MKFTTWFGIITLVLGFAVRAAEPVTSRYNAPYPTPASKKGLQVEIVADALDRCFAGY